MVPEHPLRNLLEIIGNTADAFTAALFSKAPGADQWELAAHFSLSRQFNPNATVKPGEGWIGLSTRKSQLVMQEYSGEDAPEVEIYNGPEPLKAMLALPVKGDTLLGVLYLDSKEQYGFPTKVQKMLSHFADQLAWHLQQMRNPTGANLAYPARLMGNRFLPVLVQSVEDEIFSDDRTITLLQLNVVNLKPVPRPLRETVLNELGERLSHALPKPKLIFQSSETALAVLLVNCDTAQALAREPEIQNALQSFNIQVSGKAFQPKVDITTAEYPSGAEGLLDLLRTARDHTAPTQERMHA